MRELQEKEYKEWEKKKDKKMEFEKRYREKNCNRL